VRDHTGTPTPTTDVVTWGGVTGLNAGFETKIGLTAPAASVDIALANFSAAPTVTAYDASAVAVDSATVTVAGAPETLHLTGPGIVTLVVTSPQNETLILELCAG
jgi:hypothetical protein